MTSPPSRARSPFSSTVMVLGSGTVTLLSGSRDLTVRGPCVRPVVVVDGGVSQPVLLPFSPSSSSLSIFSDRDPHLDSPRSLLTSKRTGTITSKFLIHGTKHFQ